MKEITLLIYILLTFSWLYILIFSIKEIKKSKLSSKSLFIILFTILIIDASRTLIESAYFGTRLASQYGFLPKELFQILSNPMYLFVPKLINAIAAIAIIILIFRKWYPEKILQENILEEKYLQEKKDKEELAKLNKMLDRLVEEKTYELQELNKNLEQRVKEEVLKNELQERRLFTQSKMATMGEMIKNIAHQWRQPLSTITTIASGTSYKQEFGILDQKELKENLTNIIDTAQYMSQTVSDFQNFFKPNKFTGELNSKDVIENTLKLVSPMLKSTHITIQKDFDDLCQLKIPANELQQVLINILNNAKDAFEDKNYDKFIKISTSKKQDKCVINILDNAGGIKEEYIKNIFEPYFTTKGKEEGTGLGLYMAKEIVEKHLAGKIKVSIKEYENKLGTQFEIVLPII